MLSRAIGSVLVLLAVSSTRGQDVFVNGLPRTPVNGTGGNVESAWLDLRQTSTANSKPQSAPDWVESVGLVPGEATEDSQPKTIFRIRLKRPRTDFQVLFFRLFFNDNPDQKPQLVAWDESGSQVLQSGPLGTGLGVPTSESVIVPMVVVSTIDVEVPGDGKTIRGAYLDWMATAEVLHPIGAEHRDLIPAPFAAMPPLHAPSEDKEMFGTVTATLADETIRIGAKRQHRGKSSARSRECPLPDEGKREKTGPGTQGDGRAAGPRLRRPCLLGSPLPAGPIPPLAAASA